MDMGIVNAGMVGVYDELDPELRERVEDVVLNRRPDAGERLVEIAESAKGAAKDDSKKNEWRAGTVEQRLSHALVQGITDFIVDGHRRGLSGGAGQGRPAAARDRRPADGRHEHRGRPVRPGQDVPAAGGEVGARDEAGGGPPDSLHRGREEAAGGRRRGRQGQGQDRHRHRQGRRARHRQEHRHRGAPVQQLRSGEHGRDGAVPRDPGARQGRGRRHRRPVGPDHAVPGRDAVRRRRDAEGRSFPHPQDPAADRRRDHQPRAHRGEDRAALRRAGGLRARCLAQRERGAGPAVRPGGRVHRRARGRLREGAARSTPTRSRCRCGRWPKARANKTPIDWAGYTPPVPKFLGRRVFRNFDLAELAKYIDWGPFFQTWDLAGPFPAILKDEVVGTEARARLCRRPAHAQAPDRRPLAHRQRGDGLLPGQHA